MLKLEPQKARRIQTLLDKANAGRIIPAEKQELEVLVHESEIITLKNAQGLAAGSKKGKQRSKAVAARESRSGSHALRQSKGLTS